MGYATRGSRLGVLLMFCLFFTKFQPSVAYKIVAYKRKRVNGFSWSVWGVWNVFWANFSHVTDNRSYLTLSHRPQQKFSKIDYEELCSHYCFSVGPENSTFRRLTFIKTSQNLILAIQHIGEHKLHYYLRSLQSHF